MTRIRELLTHPAAEPAPDAAELATLVARWPWFAPVRTLHAAAGGGAVFLLLGILSRGALGGGDIKFCGILGLVYGPSGMALVFLTAAVTAMPVIFLLRRLYRTGQPLAIPFLPFLACGCCTATLAQLFLR